MKPFSTTSEQREWDYVVVGSGMGGLSSAALLSMLGKRVLVIEQHYVPGGFTHTFKRKRWTWDVGVHAVGEVTERSLIGRVLGRLTQGQLQWASLGEVYDEFHYPDGFHIDFPNDRSVFIDRLKTAFPNDTRAITEYIQYIQQVAATMKGYYLSRVFPWQAAPLTDRLLARRAHQLFSERTQDVLDRISGNDRLKTVLASQWGYYGSPPSRSAFAIHALVARHFFFGGYYPVGGAKHIAHALMSTVAQGGGWTRISSEVDEIVVKNGRAAGVRLKDGETIAAKAVISAAGGLGTVQRLLPEEQRARRWAQSLAALQPSPAHVCLNLGFAGDIRQAGAGAANKWFYEHWDTAHEAWDIADPKAIAPVLYTSFPSLKDPAHTSEAHTGEVVTFVPWQAFEQWRSSRWMRRGQDYDALKAELSQRLLNQLFAHMPALKDRVAYAELSTPLSTEHFTRATAGAIYGIEPTPERFSNRWLRPRSPLAGLYLAGADVGTVGVVGAFLGGVLAAVAAEPVSALRLLRSAAQPRA